MTNELSEVEQAEADKSDWANLQAAAHISAPKPIGKVRRPKVKRRKSKSKVQRL